MNFQEKGEMAMQYDFITLEKKDGIAILTLNRPE